MKKFTILVALLLTITLVLSGCTTNTTEEPTATNEPEPTEETTMDAETPEPEVTMETEVTTEPEETMEPEEPEVVTYMDISVEDAKALIDSMPEIVIIDVSPYHANGHIPNALSYPVGSGAFGEAVPTFDMDKTYLIYCHADAPAITAAEMLIDAGFTKVYRLIGNYGAWVDAGYPVEQ